MDDSHRAGESMDGGLRFSLSAALSKQYALDQREFLAMLALMVESAMPEMTEVDRRGSLFAKKRVRRVTVTFGENRYSLEDPGRGPLEAKRTRVVRGIALKTEPMTVPEWVAEFGAAMENEVDRNEAARDALSRFGI